MSEFTLDIQLTELGFSNWNFPLCEPQSVKENFLPTQNGTEKPAAETETPTDCHEDACVVRSASADKSFLQDHQYFTPFTDNSSNGETAQSNSKIISTENKDKAICNSWNRGRRRKEIEQSDDDDDDDYDYEDDEDDEDDEEENGQVGKKNNDKEQKCSEVSQEASGLTIDDAMSGEERTDEDAEIVLTDDDVDEEDEVEEEEEEEEDDVEEEGKVEEEGDDDVSWSETNGSGENKENRCHVCDLTFSSLFLLREHLNMHTGGSPLPLRRMWQAVLPVSQLPCTPSLPLPEGVHPLSRLLHHL
ncbi:zinc finger protein hangover-like isoform X2 [Labeo rohita]|nr:zinc finger protein hangover-like isoform X2 [Labeo rohita]